MYLCCDLSTFARNLYIGESLFSFLTNKLQYVGNGALLRSIVEYVGPESSNESDLSFLWAFFLWRDCEEKLRSKLFSFWQHLFAFTEVLDLPKLASMGYEDSLWDLLCVLPSKKLTLRGPFPDEFKKILYEEAHKSSLIQALPTTHLTLTNLTQDLKKTKGKRRTKQKKTRPPKNVWKEGFNPFSVT